MVVLENLSLVLLEGERDAEILAFGQRLAMERDPSCIIS